MIKKFIKKSVFAMAILSSAALAATVIYDQKLPDSFRVSKGSALELGATAEVTARTGNESYSEGYNATLSLFGMIPIKDVSVNIVEQRYVGVCGTPFGVRMFTDGVLVVGMTDIDSQNGLVNPARNAGIKTGDIIVSIEGTQVTANEDVAALIEQSSGKPLTFKIRRQNMTFDLQFTPVMSIGEDKYKAGLWVRDSSAGIGTLTFITEDTGFAAGLGHGICDSDTGEIMPISAGDIVKAEIISIQKGTRGTPGELRGRFSTETSLGQLISNNESGVYSSYSAEIPTVCKAPVANRQEIKTGAAKILTTIDGQGPKYYDCTIEKVNYDLGTPTQNITLKITDKTLLEKTGGIVQGMSGSPILQNGKLIGAVTHVFINDSARGYGIFAENMLATSDSLNQTIKKAS